MSHPVSETPRTEGMEMSERLPSYPLETPTADQVRVLDYVDSADDAVSTPSKSDLIAFAEEADLSFLATTDPANDKAKFALVSYPRLKPWACSSVSAWDSCRRKPLVAQGQMPEAI